MVRLLKWRDTSPGMKNQHLLNVYGNGQGWTTEPPTQDGWYWVRDTDGDLNLAKHTRDGWYICGIEVEFYALEDFTHWLGPLPIPTLPEDVK